MSVETESPLAPAPSSPEGERRPPRWRVWLGRMLWLLLLAAVAEGAIRVGTHLIHRGRGVEPHPVLGWKPVPEVTKLDAAWGGSTLARTNSRGWRDGEHALGPAPGEHRVLLLGDSMIFGQGVGDEERVSERLEDESGVAAINLGVAGWGTDQQVLAYEVEGHRYHPDVTVLCTFFGNDLDDIRYRVRWRWPKPWFRLDAHGREALVPPAESWWVKLRANSYLAEMAGRAFHWASEPSVHASPWREGDTVPLYRALVRRLREGVSADGGHLLVVLLYVRREDPVARRGREERTLAALDADAVPHLDTLAPFVRSRLDGQDPWLPDSHFNPHGHALLARLIREEIRRRGWR